MPNFRWVEGFGRQSRQSLQDSAFPGRSLGTSVFLVAIGEKCHFKGQKVTLQFKTDLNFGVFRAVLCGIFKDLPQSKAF